MFKEAAYNRIITIGDIHGYLKPVKKLLDKIKPEENDLLIFIGDYIDRGPVSKDVVDYLIELSLNNRNIHFLKGNHEDMFLGSIGYDAVVKDFRIWLYNGGSQTLKSYGMDNDEIMQLTKLWDDSERYRYIMEYVPRSHLNFFIDTKLWFETENYFFCHAGMNPYNSVEEGKKNVKDLLWIREHLYYEDYDWEKTVVCGHTPLQEIMIKDKLICIDTGLYYYGVLSAIDVLSREVYQVSI